ncbi:phage terminase small subunit [Thalassobacillus sp. C254]|uniref:phage terminase small subunit n=1 Tax=Thalassobacillus sp. C254 TaxID=1225341 RepID=UPI00277D07A3|nr:phage terminase small subunit [Thalassobacillus sp. C254]
MDKRKGASKQKSVHTKKKGGQPGNINAKGHGAPPRNTNAVKHGLFSKFLPDETLEIVSQMSEVSPADILWMNIELQFASIMRAQQIMFVESKEEMIKEIKKEKESWGDTSSSSETEWEFQFAWDRQATFLNSQSRAMGELRGMLKQFNEMVHEDDERMLQAERMKATLDKTKKETEFIEERTKLIKGTKKDTSLLEALIQARKGEE